LDTFLSPEITSVNLHVILFTITDYDV
jgi:hypothetical protein